MQIGTSSPRGKKIKRSSFEVRRSNVKVKRRPEVRFVDLAEASFSTHAVESVFE